MFDSLNTMSKIKILTQNDRSIGIKFRNLTYQFALQKTHFKIFISNILAILSRPKMLRDGNDDMDANAMKRHKIVLWSVPLPMARIILWHLHLPHSYYRAACCVGRRATSEEFELLACRMVFIYWRKSMSNYLMQGIWKSSLLFYSLSRYLQRM